MIKVILIISAILCSGVIASAEEVQPDIPCCECPCCTEENTNNTCECNCEIIDCENPCCECPCCTDEEPTPPQRVEWVPGRG